VGEARLVLVRGAAAPAGCALPRQGGVLLGRDASCDLVLEDERVSGRHARVEAHGDGWQVKDLDSANGTFVNGEDVAEKVLAPGDELELGDVVLRLEVAGVAAPAPLRVPGVTVHASVRAGEAAHHPARKAQQSQPREVLLHEREELAPVRGVAVGDRRRARPADHGHHPPNRRPHRRPDPR